MTFQFFNSSLFFVSFFPLARGTPSTPKCMSAQESAFFSGTESSPRLVDGGHKSLYRGTRRMKQQDVIAVLEHLVTAPEQLATKDSPKIFLKIETIFRLGEKLVSFTPPLG
jgi:hypothetical protein